MARPGWVFWFREFADGVDGVVRLDQLAAMARQYPPAPG